MRKTQLGCTILEGHDVADLPLVSENAEILEKELLKKATQEQDGRMSKEDKTKLDGIEAGANKYVHPKTHSADIIIPNADRRFVSDTEKEAWNAKETPEGAQAKVDAVQANLDEHKADCVHLPYSIADGTNTYTTLINGISSLAEGMSIKIKFTNANTGASTLNINGLGAKPIQKSNGNALSSGNIKAGQIVHLVYTGSVFQLLGEGGEYGTAQAQDVLEGKTIGTEEGLVTGTMPNRGAINRTITNQNGQIIVPEGYHDGRGIVKAQFANLIAGNIRKGVNIGGVVGTLVQGIQGESSGTDVLVNIASFDWWDGEEVDSIRRYKKVLKTNVISGKCTVHFQATGNVSSQPGTYLCSCYVYKNNNQIGSTSLYVRDVGADKEKETTYKSIEINLSGSKDDEYEFRMDAEGRPTEAGIELSFKTTGIEKYN